ncbi:MAG TPA: response regulator transcription factor [Candidatus Dormibacteraeota bacterium]|nr:response regulator transcription factor [Candidatus Dormibacteraeota bacterium]
MTRSGGRGRPRNQPVVLVADDEPEILRLVRLCLMAEGFRVVTAEDGRRTLELVSEVSPDAVILDIVMPGMDGIRVMRELRETHPVPIILLTGRASTADVAEGLDLGADDYIVKPFNPAELVARTRAVIRRAAQTRSLPATRIGDLTVDIQHREVSRDGRPIPLSRPEWLLLQQFVANPGRILRHEELLTAVWGPEYRDDLAYLRVWVGQLRRSLGIPPWQEGAIRTIHGLGYALDVEGRIPQMRSRRPTDEEIAAGAVPGPAEAADGDPRRRDEDRRQEVAAVEADPGAR